MRFSAVSAARNFGDCHRFAQSYVLEHPVKDGRGKLRIDDTLWDILGPDLPAGARVKVFGVERLRLRVDQV